MTGEPATSALVPPAPAAAAAVFGAELPAAERYARLLAGAGIERGLMGPREVERLWQRHLLNSAAVAELLPSGARVVDVGSGAGLPGIALAIARPDLHVDLVESVERRTAFLNEACRQLELGDRVRVLRGRAEDASIVKMVGSADWVTARAVAPLARLVRWCLPLLRPGGHLLAMKGATALDELERDRSALRASGADSADVVQVGATLDEPTWVVRIRRGATPSLRTGDVRKGKR